MIGLPIKWWLLGGGLLLTLWLVWQAPSVPDNNIIVIEAVQPSAKLDDEEIETPPHYQIPVKRQSPEMASDLFRIPPHFVVPAIKLTETTIPSTPKALSPLPFHYIGRIEKDASVTVFIMEGEALYLLKAGDSPRVDYQLEAIDLAAGELRWRHIPTQKIRNMSIKP